MQLMKAFYVVAGGTGKIAEMQYNDDKTSLGSINLLSTDYLGAGPFEVSEQSSTEGQIQLLS